MSHGILYRDMSVTYCTRKWLLSWMSLLLIPKPTCFGKFLTTFFTGTCLWHTIQVYGFSPEWVFCWFLNLHALENVSWHTLQDMSLIYSTRIWLLPWKSLLLIPKPTCFKKCLTTFFTGICLQKMASPQKGLLPKKDFSPKDGVSPEYGFLQKQFSWINQNWEKIITTYISTNMLSSRSRSIVGGFTLCWHYFGEKSYDMKPCQFVWVC